MQVTVEKKEGINCSLLIEVPATEIDTEIKKRIQKLTRTVKMDGFRPGKVPAGLIKKRYGNSVRYEVVSDLVSKKNIEAIQQEKLEVAGITEVQIQQDEAGKNLKYIAKLELFPEFEVTGLDKITIKKPVVNMSEEQMEKMMLNLRRQFATWNEADRAVQKDDKVAVDFIGLIDGEVFEGGSANGSQILIGSNQMIPGFEDGIIGMNKDEEKTITLTFPMEYQNKELAGKEATFEIVVKSIQEADLPEINDEFIAKFDMSGTAEDFEKEIRSNMERELKFAIQKKIKDQVFAGLRDVVEFEIPNTLLKRDTEQSKKQWFEQIGGAKSNLKLDQIPDDMFRKQAEERVKTSLIVQNILEKETFSADEQSVDNLIDEMSSSYQDSENVKVEMKKNQKELNNIKAVVVENKLVDWVVSQAKVEEQEEDFFEIIKSVMQQNMPQYQ